MKQHAPLSSATAGNRYRPKHRFRNRLPAKVAAAVTIAAGALMFTMSTPATVNAQDPPPSSCDLVEGSVYEESWGRWAGLNIAASPAAESSRGYNVMLFNQGPIGLQSFGVLESGATALNVSFDPVDIGYAARRAAERAWPQTFRAAITPSYEPATSENSTFCTGTVTWIDNPADGTHFEVRH